DSMTVVARTSMGNAVGPVKIQPKPIEPAILAGPVSSNDALTTLHAQLHYARVTRDSVALMPGARSYERSWIRDGALSANAFLRMGQPDVAKDFARWFAR